MNPTFIRQQKPIDPNSGGNSRPPDSETDRISAVCLARTRAKRAEAAADQEAAEISCEMSTARAVRTNGTRTPTRDAFQRHLRMAIYSLQEAAKLNPNEEHALTMIQVEVGNVADGSPGVRDDEIDFGESLEAGMPEH